MKTLKILLALSVALGLANTAFANSEIIEGMKQRYNPEVTYCKNDNSLLNISKQVIVNDYSSHAAPSLIQETLKKYPFDAYRICNESIKPVIVSAFNQAKLINGKANSVISEFKASNAQSGSSFYSNTLGETVGVVDARDMINGTGESYKYVVKTNQSGQAKLMVQAGTINEKTNLVGSTSGNVFKAGRYVALSPKNAQTAKIGNTYFIYIK